MSAETIAAVAACAAAVLSLVGVGYQGYLANRSDDRHWLRESLPDALLGFQRATHEMQRLWFFSSEEDRSLSPSELEERAAGPTADAFRWQDRLELIASPNLVTATLDVIQAIDSGRMYLLEVVVEGLAYDVAQDREFYWRYAEAAHTFLAEARSVLGLKPPPVPPGLAAWRQHE